MLSAAISLDTSFENGCYYNILPSLHYRWQDVLTDWRWRVCNAITFTLCLVYESTVPKSLGHIMLRMQINIFFKRKPKTRNHCCEIAVRVAYTLVTKKKQKKWNFLCVIDYIVRILRNSNVFANSRAYYFISFYFILLSLVHSFIAA